MSGGRRFLTPVPSAEQPAQLHRSGGAFLRVYRYLLHQQARHDLEHAWVRLSSILGIGIGTDHGNLFFHHLPTRAPEKPSCRDSEPPSVAIERITATRR